MDKTGKTHERVYDIAVSDERKIDNNGIAAAAEDVVRALQERAYT